MSFQPTCHVVTYLHDLKTVPLVSRCPCAQQSIRLHAGMRRRQHVYHRIPRAMLLSSAPLAIRFRRIPVPCVTPKCLSSKIHQADAQGCLGSDGGAAGRNGCGVCAAAWYAVLSTALHAQQPTRAERIAAIPRAPFPPPSRHLPPARLFHHG